jgi:hypothetical protein
MARGEAIRFGPFVGGLNTGSDPTAVADAEMVECVNFELDIDGSLVQRLPIVEVANPGQDHLLIIGSALISNTGYIVASNSSGTYVFDGVGWTTIKAGLTSKVALQYRNLIYIVATPGSAQQGGYWSPGGGFTTDAAMPRGEAALFTKTRMFVVPGRSAISNTSRVQFTDPVVADLPTWNPVNIIDVSPGDGQNLIDIVLYNDNLMLFKQDSTYVLAYDLQPTDAILRCVNTNIGASAAYCVQVYENSVFCYHEGKVYEIINYDFSQINIKVPFVFDGAVPAGSTRVDEVFLNLLGDRLLLRYYNRIYAFGLKTRTWTRWESENEDLQNFGPLVAFPSNPTQSVNTKYYAGSSLSNKDTLVYIPDGRDSITRESTISDDVDIISNFVTKNFDMADSHHFKKLMWWGADVLTNQDIVGLATPIVTNFKVYWNDLISKTWYEVSGNTWYSPLTVPATVETDVGVTSSASRKFVKFKKTLRFRQINFSVTLKGDGSTSTGPCRLFTLTAIIGSKETVSKQVT